MSKGRHHIVNGVGSGDASIFFIGEAPGAEEDAKGEPFVGRSGRFFNSVLAERGIKRNKVYVTNVVRCRPPGNRKPSKEEISSCLPALVDELKKIRPKVVVPMGATAINSLIGVQGRLKSIIGRPLEADLAGLHTTVVPCYHPSAAMRNNDMKAAFRKAVFKAISLSK